MECTSKNPYPTAAQLWKAPGLKASTTTQKNIALASDYLREFGYKLKKVESDGNCFFTAFFKSYLTIKSKRSIPLIDMNLKPIPFLREALAATILDITRKNEVLQEGEFVNITEGIRLGNSIFKIPIRVLAPQTPGISDVLYFENPKKEGQDWKNIPNEERPKTYIFIVDLGGHFVYAAPQTHPFKMSRLSTPISYRGCLSPLPYHRPQNL